MIGENIKTVEKAGGIWALAGGFGRGVLLAVAFTLVTFAAFACILAYSALSQGAIPVIATVTEAIGALIAGFCTARRKGNSGLLSGLLAGVGYMLILWVIALLAGDGFSMGAHSLSMLLFSALGGVVGGVLGVNLKSGRTNKRKR